MMEQYLDGPEVDVDVVLNAEGDVVYGNVTDNWPTIEPYFNETGGASARPPCGARPVRAWLLCQACSLGALGEHSCYSA